MTEFTCENENMNIENNEFIQSKNIKKSFLDASSEYKTKFLKETEKSYFYELIADDGRYYISLDIKNNDYIKIDYPVTIDLYNTKNIKNISEDFILKCLNLNNKKIKSTKTTLTLFEKNDLKVIFSMEMFIFSTEMVNSIEQFIKRSFTLKSTALKSLLLSLEGGNNE